MGRSLSPAAPDASIRAVEQSLISVEESAKLALHRASALARGTFVRAAVPL